MSDQDTSTPSTKSWGSTIVIGVIMLIVVVGLIFFIYYIFLQTPINPYPISQFKFGDTIQISPAVLTKENLANTTVDQNQYLVKNTVNDCYSEESSPSPSCVITFSGNKNDPNTKWVLEKLPYTGNTFESADQNVLLLGNRFYLRNATNNPTDLAGRPRMNLFDSSAIAGCSGLSPDKTFPLTSPNLGSCYDPGTELNRGNELILYFWPTTQPDLYYILFPGTLGVPSRIAINATLATQPNDGVVTLRPFAPWNSGNTYNPFMSNGELFNNAPLLNAQSSYPVGVKYPTPEVFLFKVIKV